MAAGDLRGRTRAAARAVGAGHLLPADRAAEDRLLPATTTGMRQGAELGHHGAACGGKRGSGSTEPDEATVLGLLLSSVSHEVLQPRLQT